jgi:hypothetical protein
MNARLMVILALIAGLLTGPGALAFCPATKAVKACCKCCAANSSKPCGMAAKAGCELPVPLDRSTGPDSKPVPGPQIVGFAVIQYFLPVARPCFFVKSVGQIHSPPPLSLTCIRLI